VLQTGQLRLASDVYSFGILLWELVHLGLSQHGSSSGGSGAGSTSTHQLGSGFENFSISSGKLSGSLREAAASNLTAQPESPAALPSAETSPPDPAALSQISSGQAAQAIAGQAAVVSASCLPDSAPQTEASDGRNALISRVYQELGSSPWAILSKVVEGMRPVFVASAVPGPYVQLAQRCWDIDPTKRPSFDEIVALLEEVVDGDGLTGGSGKRLQDGGMVESF
jgi:hypothetical protein